MYIVQGGFHPAGVMPIVPLSAKLSEIEMDSYTQDIEMIRTYLILLEYFLVNASGLERLTIQMGIGEEEQL